MHSIHCHFQRIPDVLAVDLLDNWGVYVLWDGKSVARPAYIGEGSIWQRFLEHREWTSRPFDGYVAGFDERFTKSLKQDMQIVEAALLWIADETDRLPAQNARGGNMIHLEGLFKIHGVVKIFIDGFDPLQDPATARTLSRKKSIRLSVSSDGTLEMEDDWRRRRTR